MNGKYKTATIEEVFDWLQEGIFVVRNGEVFKGEKQLAQRVNLRNRCEHGDARVDLFHNRKRRSCHVSQLVWMVTTWQPIPPNFEIHHRDEDCNNNEPGNLICVHRLDHPKLHGEAPTNDEDEIPF